jgi:predicted dienelactone hydrolase
MKAQETVFQNLLLLGAMLAILLSLLFCPEIFARSGFGTVLVPRAAGAGGEAAPSQARFNIGYQVLDFKSATETLTVAVWYPTATPPKLHHYGGPTYGDVAVDAPAKADDGPYPLLVFSHGYGGSGIAYVYLTEALAARGWIVACPDHHDKDSSVRIRTGPNEDLDRVRLMRDAEKIAASSPTDQGKYFYRLEEMKLALDDILASKRFGPLIARNRIAVAGHSFGGFTALGLCGTIRKYYDPRIKAVLLFSPQAGAYLYTADELKKVRVPSMVFMGSREENQRRGSATVMELMTKMYKNVSPPKYFLEIRGAGHFSFNNDCFSNTFMARLLSGTKKQFEVIRRYSIAFLEKYVTGRGDPEDVLGHRDPMLTRYERDLGTNAAWRAPEAH